MEQIPELAWNILDWDSDADLGSDNLQYNMRETFVRRYDRLPKAWVVRPDQAHKLFQQFKTIGPDANHFSVIDTPFGYFSLIIVHDRLKEGL